MLDEVFGHRAYEVMMNALADAGARGSFHAGAHGRARSAGGSAGPSGPRGGAAGGGPPPPPFPPFSGFPWSFFRRARAKRGDVRAAILSLLSEKPLNGYQIMQELEQRSRGSWRPSPGAVYPALQQLEDEGLVRVEVTAGGRVHALTEAGRAYVREHEDEIASPWECSGPTCDESVIGLFGELKHIASASMQVLHTGSAQHVREAQKILNHARKALYRMLAEDGVDGSDQP